MEFAVVVVVAARKESVEVAEQALAGISAWALVAKVESRRLLGLLGLHP